METYYKRLILIIIVLCACLLYMNFSGEDTSSKRPLDEFQSKIIKQVDQNEIVLNGENSIVNENDLSEYDFKTKNEIYDLRKYFVQKTMGNFVKNYTVNEDVFGSIVDNRPWWGMNGIICRGPGQNSIDGPSEEGRFINNPLILIGIDFPYAINVPNWYCDSVYPKTAEIKVKPSQNKIVVTYNLTDFAMNIANTHWADIEYLYVFKGLNARDFGYEYAYLDRYDGIVFKETSNISTHVYKFLDYIHAGGSCGYNGGCNNGSPLQSELVFKVLKTPAVAEFKLYRKEPSSKESDADLLFTLILE